MQLMGTGSHGSHGKNVMSRAVVAGSYVRGCVLVLILEGAIVRARLTMQKIVTCMSVLVNISCLYSTHPVELLSRNIHCILMYEITF